MARKDRCFFYSCLAFTSQSWYHGIACKFTRIIVCFIIYIYIQCFLSVIEDRCCCCPVLFILCVGAFEQVQETALLFATLLQLHLFFEGQSSSKTFSYRSWTSPGLYVIWCTCWKPLFPTNWNTTAVFCYILLFLVLYKYYFYICWFFCLYIDFAPEKLFTLQQQAKMIRLV